MSPAGSGTWECAGSSRSFKPRDTLVATVGETTGSAGLGAETSSRESSGLSTESTTF